MGLIFFSTKKYWINFLELILYAQNEKNKNYRYLDGNIPQNYHTHATSKS